MSLMKTRHDVGIVGFGGYVPRFRVDTACIAEHWSLRHAPASAQKSFPDADEDTITMAIEATRNALHRARVPACEIAALWVGSESKPYAVKPCGTVVAEAIGAGPHLLAADFEFACKSGTEALQAGFGFVGSGMGRFAVCVGMDAAQSKPGDELEYTAAAGGAAFVVGPGERAVATLLGSASYVTDTPDFFRRAFSPYPEHGRRFTGTPGYLHHAERAATSVLEGLELRPEDVHHVVFHQPTHRFPLELGKRLGFRSAQLEAGLLFGDIGNAYSGSSTLGLCAALEAAQPQERILCVSYGSGAGSDAIVLQTTDAIVRSQSESVPRVRDYIARGRTVSNYATYLRMTGSIRS